MNGKVAGFGDFSFLRAAVISGSRVRFEHALTQEVAYNSVLTQRRRIFHGRIGTAIEKLYINRLDDHVADLGHHFARSADAAKSVECLRVRTRSSGAALQVAKQRSVRTDALVE